MTFSFKYKPVKLKTGETLYRPLIPITLEGEEKIDVLAMLDSGSDITIIPEELAEVLGVEYKKDNIIYGISREPVDAKEGKIYVKFGKGNEFYSFEIPILVPTGKLDLPIIIGRAGFFNQFKIIFIESERRIEFKRLEPFQIKYN
ncbi:MAG: retropepsin-like domain-containing protein [Nanoarchaeota archaeon]|nr:retropepsin-like domain-containing protein [Nanoarchaeota archaeon]